MTTVDYPNCPRDLTECEIFGAGGNATPESKNHDGTALPVPAR